ncbi:serine--tRNA ligase [candidate division WOR-3 bacterium JGI_Cruoil_03_44_89]|uniref:Serine--tRNA ligase n=1 Tax=candidate division WOR-3 bacterium JGI_Cruoil_03_44_89 TaxID=1973748 RepID=A0A235BT18_UNCW3|nr:MAG: serine--tRNA ligase [candidate division WOR-3 bacterium JGI_Cruoil_03_44_89]
MLDIAFIRDNIELVKEAIRNKGEDVDMSSFSSLDGERRTLIKERDEKRRERKAISRRIGELKREGKNTDAEEKKAKRLAKEVKKIDERLSELEKNLNEVLVRIPNIPHPSVPVEGDKIIVRERGEKRDFDFEPLSYLDLADALSILDLKRGVKVASTSFPAYRGDGARLVRSLINFMLDTHTSRGYTEVFTPFLANRESMFGTGQLPKLEYDMYRIEKDDLFLNPTAEVPITNLHKDETIPKEKLPIKYVGYAASFRREAGSYGKDTKGLVRVHQFNKVELVKFTLPEDSYDELETLLEDAEMILRLLCIPYRVRLLPINDMSFASAKTYDIEVWAPVLKRWLEVSSVSNFEDFQARRAKIRFKGGGKSGYVHTLNASGVALPRLFIALLENYEQRNGSVRIPEKLVPYMGKKLIG